MSKEQNTEAKCTCGHDEDTHIDVGCFELVDGEIDVFCACPIYTPKALPNPTTNGEESLPMPD